MFCSKATSTRSTIDNIILWGCWGMRPSSRRRIFAPDHQRWIFLELKARLLKRLNYMKDITKSSPTKMLPLLLPRVFWTEQAQCARENAMNLCSPKDSTFKSVSNKNAGYPPYSTMPQRSLKKHSQKPLTWRSLNVINLVMMVALLITRLAYRDISAIKLVDAPLATLWRPSLTATTS